MRLINMLLLTLPGTPTTYYGEEIGMENINITESQMQDPAGKYNKVSTLLSKNDLNITGASLPSTERWLFIYRVIRKIGKISTAFICMIWKNWWRRKEFIARFRGAECFLSLHCRVQVETLSGLPCSGVMKSMQALTANPTTPGCPYTQTTSESMWR